MVFKVKEWVSCCVSMVYLFSLDDYHTSLDYISIVFIDLDARIRAAFNKKIKILTT